MCVYVCVRACVCVCVCLVAQSCLTFCNPLDCRLPALMFMGFSRQEYRSRLPFPFPEGLPDPKIKPTSPALADRFFTHWSIREAHLCLWTLKFPLLEFPLLNSCLLYLRVHHWYIFSTVLLLKIEGKCPWVSPWKVRKRKKKNIIPLLFQQRGHGSARVLADNLVLSSDWWKMVVLSFLRIIRNWSLITNLLK